MWLKIHKHSATLLIALVLSACGTLDSEQKRPKQNYDSNIGNVVGTIEVLPEVKSAEQKGVKNQKTENPLDGGSFFIRAPNGTGVYISKKLNNKDEVDAKDINPQPFALSLASGKYKIINWSLSNFQNNQNSLLPKRDIFFEVAPGKTTYIGRFTIDKNLKIASIEDKYSEDILSIKNLLSSTVPNENGLQNSNQLSNEIFTNKLKSLDKSISSTSENIEKKKNASQNYQSNNFKVDNGALSYAKWMLPTAENFDNGMTEIKANNITVQTIEILQSAPSSDSIVTTPLPSDIMNSEALEVIRSIPVEPKRNTRNFVASKPVISPRTSNLQLTRDLSARTIIESELHKANSRLNELIKEFNNGQPEKLASEVNNEQRYQNRIIEIKANIARTHIDIQSIQRELSRMAR